MEEPLDGFPLLLLRKVLWVRPQNAASVPPVPHGLQDDGVREGFVVAHAITAFTAAIKTAASIAKWNRGEIAVGLIHPASAGHGLNLQAGGSTLAWFGLCWSLELYQQTNARLYRQGQRSTVVVTHIIAEDTIDEHILAALKQKDKTQAALIAAVKAVIA